MAVLKYNAKSNLYPLSGFPGKKPGGKDSLYSGAMGLNVKIQMLKTVGCGNHQFQNFETAILIFHGQ